MAVSTELNSNNLDGASYLLSMAVTTELNSNHVPAVTSPDASCCNFKPASYSAAYFQPLRCKYCTVYLYNYNSYMRHIHRHRLKYTKSPWHQTPHSKGERRRRLHNHCTRNSANETSELKKSPRRDIRNVPRRYMYRCSECIRLFPTYKQLSHHAKNHILQCKVGQCRAIFKTPAALSAHIESHEPQHPKHRRKNDGLENFCPICTMDFKKRLLANSHIREVHLKGEQLDFENWKKCQECLWDRHYVSKTCEYCLERFGNVHDLWIHMKVHGEESQQNGPDLLYLCTICQKRFKSNSNLRVHRNEEHKEQKPYQCAFCNAHFKTSQLKYHVQIATAKQKYDCPVCVLKCRSKCHLMSHICKEGIRYSDYLQQNDMQPNRNQSKVDVVGGMIPKSSIMEECYVCKKLIKSSYMRTHVKTMHTSEELQHYDMHPNRKQSKVDVIDKGRTIPKSSKMEECYVCKKLIKSSYMKTHLQTMHTSEELQHYLQQIPKSSMMEECYVCKKLIKSSYMKTHLKTMHASEELPSIPIADIPPQLKLHVCKVCRMPYKHKRSLNDHMKRKHRASMPVPDEAPSIVPGKPQYKCHICVAAYTDPDSLNRHIREEHARSPENWFKSNRRSKGWRCVACRASFNKRKKLNAHMRKKHPGLPHNPRRGKLVESSHPCLFCPSVFTQREALVAHISISHDYEGVPVQRVTYTLSDKTDSNNEGSSMSDRHASEGAPVRKATLPDNKHSNKGNNNQDKFPNGNPLVKSNSQNKSRQTQHKGYKCEICCKKFVMLHNLTKHMHAYHPKTKVHNGSVGKSNSTRKRVVVGSQNTSQHDGYECEICKKRFMLLHNLIKHTQTHHPKKDEQQFKCGYCRKGFAKKGLLSQHMIQEHISEDI